ncbi:MAG: amidohydrolase family protein [Hyphomonadaceae bacterium]|nr:amidohydrolase family protein [Hyphomonadaceae bacterium]
MTIVVLRNARIWDGVSEDLCAGGEVLIENGRIGAVGRVRMARTHETIDMRDRFVMPGLIDAHFHAYWGPASVAHVETLPLSYLAHHARRLLENALRRGFTTVRDAGGADWGLWKAHQDGLFDGPRLFYAGRALSQTGGHGDGRMQHVEPCGCRFIANLSEVADGVDDVRKAARETLRRGAHHIKIFLSGGVVSPTDPLTAPQYGDDEIAAVVEEAARRGAYVMAHAYTAESALRGARLGVRSIEHGNLIDDAAAEAMARAGVFLTPTLITYAALRDNAESLGLSAESAAKLDLVAERGADAVRRARKAGVQIAFGTDLAGPLHSLQRDEFRMRAAIEAPIDILRSATSVGAALLQRGEEIGRLAEGALADIIAVDGDPRQDISTLFSDRADPPFIMQAGRVFAQH